MKKFKRNFRKLIKGFGRSVPSAITVSGFEFGMEISETPKVETNLIAQERTYDNSKKVELNNLKNVKNSHTLVKIGNGDVLAWRKKTDSDQGLEKRKAYFKQLMLGNTEELDALESTGEIQLAKNSSGNGVDAFPVMPSYPERPSGSGKIPNGNGSKPPRLPSGVYRTPPRIVGSRLNGGPGGNGGGEDDSNPNNLRFNSKSSDQCQNPNYLNQKQKKKKNSQRLSKKKVIQAYQDFISKMNKKGSEVNISKDRFLELSTNPQTGEFDEKSISETEGGLELEAKGMVNNLLRPENPKVDLDFVAERAGSGETIFIDHKEMIDFGSLSDKGIDISGFPSHESVAFNMGKDSVEQKGKFIGIDQGPASIAEVVHLYNFRNIRDRTEIPLLIQAVLNGAEQVDYTDGIIFLNYE
jgi:hypothetical protein